MPLHQETTHEANGDTVQQNGTSSFDLVPNEKVQIHQAANGTNPPVQPPPEAKGIDAFTNFILGACSTLADGITKASVEHLTGKDVKGQGIYVVACDENAEVLGSGCSQTHGETQARNDRPENGSRGFFGTPDKAAGQPRNATGGSHQDPMKQTFGSTNEMHKIAKEGNWGTLRSRLTSASDHSSTVNLAGQVDGKGRTPLMLACLHGPKFPADVARLLLVANNKSASIYVLQKNGGRQYCLHIATTAGCSIEVLDILYGAYPRAASTPDGNGNMPLHLAVNNGRYRSIAGQLGMKGDDGTSTVISTSAEDIVSPPPSVITGENLSSPARSALTVDTSSVDSKQNKDDESVSTTTFTGAVAGYEEDLLNVCDFLITANQSALLHRNKRGETPLILAIYRRSPSDVLSLLLVRGGTASLKIADDSGCFPIHFCDRSPSISIVRDMADLYPGAIMQKNKLGNTPLYSAMVEGCGIATLRILLECCPKPQETVNSKNNMGINVISHGWDDLTTQKVVAAEDQDEEDARLEASKALIQSASSPMDIAGTYIGNWWDKATLLLQAAYHNTVKANSDGLLSGRVWRPVHAAAGSDCPSATVKFILQIYSEEAGNVDENLNTPLHIGASRPDIIGIETMTLLVNAHPSSTSMQNKDGFTPLHVACLYRAPLEILQLLIDTCPESTCMVNKCGQTPLFIAISMGSPVDVLRALLAARPKSVHIRDVNGMSVISLAWQLLLTGKVIEEKGLKVKEEIKRSKTNISALAVISRSSSLKGDVRLWMGKIDVLLRASFHGTVDEPLPKGRQWRAVHAACAGGTVPPDVLEFALQILPSEAEVVNEGGNLPLHIASFAPPHEAWCPPQLGSGKSIDMLIERNANAAHQSDRKGRLPLHLALASGKTWENCVKRLIDVFPEAARMRDPVTLLFPFMLAACENDSSAKGEETEMELNGSTEQTEDESAEVNHETGKAAAELATVNTVYMLLRGAPKFISYCKSDAEKLFLWRARNELVAERDNLKQELLLIETELHKRMTAAELQEIEDAKKREMARKQEEDRRSRANHLELSAQSNVKTISTVGNEIMALKETGL